MITVVYLVDLMKEMIMIMVAFKWFKCHASLVLVITDAKLQL